MARYHDIDSSIWEDLQDYSRNAKILYIFAFSNPSTRDSGIYKISQKTILLNTGLDRKSFELALKELTGKLHYDQKNKVIFVAGKLKRRLSGLKNNRNVIKSIIHDLESFSSSFVTSLFIKKYEGALKGLASLSLPLPLPLPKEIGGVGERENMKNEVIQHKKQKEKEKKKYEDTVFLTDEQYKKLVKYYGHYQTKKMIKKLDSYKDSTGKKYNNDYKAILNWVIDNTGAKKINTEVYHVKTEKPDRYNQNDRWQERPPEIEEEIKKFTKG